MPDDLAKHLYNSFWERNRPINPKTKVIDTLWAYTPFEEQAEAIISMWRNIAIDCRNHTK